MSQSQITKQPTYFPRQVQSPWLINTGQRAVFARRQGRCRRGGERPIPGLQAEVSPPNIKTPLSKLPITSACTRPRSLPPACGAFRHIHCLLPPLKPMHTRGRRGSSRPKPPLLPASALCLANGVGPMACKLPPSPTKHISAQTLWIAHSGHIQAVATSPGRPGNSC